MKKEELVGARLPRDLLSDLQRFEAVEHLDRSTAVRKLLYRAVQEWKKEYAAKLYAESRLTLERAAAEAGVSVREMMDYFRQKKIPAQYSMEDLQADLKRVYRRLGTMESKPG